MPLYLLLLIISVAMIVHVLRTGQERFWVFVLLFAPGIGSLLYALMVLLPEWQSGHAGRRLKRKLRKTIAPEARRDQAALDLKVADTVENRIAYAEESLRLKDYATARSHFEAIATGVFADDQRVLVGLARAQFGVGDHAGCRATLDRLIAAHPDFRDPDCHLLYARSLEEMGDLNQAAGEYDVLRLSYPGEEARVRYAELLLKLGRASQARELLTHVLERARGAPAYYRRDQKEWLDRAEALLKTLQ